MHSRDGLCATSMDADSKRRRCCDHDGTSPDFALDASIMSGIMPQVMSSAAIGG